jgi:ribonuclease HII
MKLFIGVDDAGRGPIIGPMLMAGTLITEKQKSVLKKLGVKDSKQVLPAKREELFEKIKEIVLSYEVIAVSPTEIDGRSETGLNLNKIEAIKSSEIINQLIKGIINLKTMAEKPEFVDIQKLIKERQEIEIEICVDCPSPNIPVWQIELEKHLEKFDNIKIIMRCEHKADVNHIACSAASILAKVTRDREIEKIKAKIGINFGSGYPADPVTVEFLEKHAEKFKHDGIFRKTWGTWNDYVKKKEQKKLDGF